MKISILSTVVFLILGITTSRSAAATDIDQQVDELLQKMTLEEKVGQMTQVTIQRVCDTRGFVDQSQEVNPDSLRDALVDHHIGSLLNVWDVALSVDEWHELITQIQDVALNETRLGIPVLYGIDAIHGTNYTREATLFPQSIAMAATRNAELVKREGAITALETRASGIPWNFNPVLGVGRHPAWPRFWETYGEDPTLCAAMGQAYIKGQEGETNDVSQPDKVASCMKHYIGYSMPLSGKDRTPAWIPERMLHEIFLPPFARAVAAGVHTVMVNSGEINGIPTHADHHLLTDVLREELGFDGLLLSDWGDVINLYDRDGVAASTQEATRMAIQAGLDMSMVPTDFSFYDDLLALVKAGEISETRVDESVRRILRLKFELGLFDNPYPDPAMKEEVGRDASWEVSLQAARQAMTLLKNDNDMLPLTKETNVLVTGPTADRRTVLNGGWTYVWQGNVEALYPTDKPTVRQAIEAKVGAKNMTYVPGSTFDQPVDIAAAVSAAQAADVAVICLGEDAYCETPGNIHDLSLPAAQLELAHAIQATGTPLVLVLLQGRPRLITQLVDGAGAILQGYLPGPQGGQAVADVLFGDHNPGGKLPFTYPRYPNDLTTYDHKPITEDGETNKRHPLFPFGHGLSYTTFDISELQTNRQTYTADDPIEVSLTVTNSGERAGQAVIDLFVRDSVRTVSPPVRELKRFETLHLEPGEGQVLQFTLTADDLSFYDINMNWVAEPGTFAVMVGDQVTTFDLTEYISSEESGD